MIFHTFNSARAFNPSLKYLRCSTTGSIGIGIGKFGFVAKTQYLRCPTLGLKDIGSRKSEFVANAQFLRTQKCGIFVLLKLKFIK